MIEKGFLCAGRACGGTSGSQLKFRWRRFVTVCQAVCALVE
jgi:hypothetical protein